MNPKVSIILSTYNRADKLSKTIESVLEQSFKDWEFLIVDDGSSDGTFDVVKKYSEKDSRIRYILNERNLGLTNSLNNGLNESKGDYISRIDDEDEWIDKGKLEKQVNFFKNNPNYLLVGTGALVVNEKGEEVFRYLGPETDKEIRKKILFKNCFVHVSVLFKKDPVLNLGGYKEDFVEDYHLWLELGTLGKFANLPFYGVKYISRSGTISTKGKSKQLKKNIQLVKKWGKDYPGYYKAIFFAYSRFLFFRLLGIPPFSFFKNKILSLYKNY